MGCATEITCPEDGCSGLFPAYDFDACSPNIIFGQINKIYLQAADQSGLTDWEDAMEWGTLIDNSTAYSTTPTVIRELDVIGSKPPTEFDEVEVSNNRIFQTPKTFTVNAALDDLSDTNYEAARQLECGGSFLMWYTDLAGYMYGNETDGCSGILVTILVDHNLPEGKKEKQTINYTIKWDASFHPARIVNPIAA